MVDTLDHGNNTSDTTYTNVIESLKDSDEKYCVTMGDPTKNGDVILITDKYFHLWGTFIKNGEIFNNKYIKSEINGTPGKIGRKTLSRSEWIKLDSAHTLDKMRGIITLVIYAIVMVIFVSQLNNNVNVLFISLMFFLPMVVILLVNKILESFLFEFQGIGISTKDKYLKQMIQDDLIGLQTFINKGILSDNMIIKSNIDMQANRILDHELLLRMKYKSKAIYNFLLFNLIGGNWFYLEYYITGVIKILFTLLGFITHGIPTAIWYFLDIVLLDFFIKERNEKTYEALYKKYVKMKDFSSIDPVQEYEKHKIDSKVRAYKKASKFMENAAGEIGDKIEKVIKQKDS